MMKKIICLFFFFTMLNLCFARNNLGVELIIEHDTINHLQSISYQIKWHNRSNDTIKVREDWGFRSRPKLEARRIGSRAWKELWLSEMDLFQTCYFRSIFNCGIRRINFLTIPPNTAVFFEASYFSIWEEKLQEVLVPGHAYEFRFVLNEEYQKNGVKQVSDIAYIDYSTEANEKAFTDIVNSNLNIYDLFKSWYSCVNDSVVVRGFQEVGRRNEDSELSALIKLKLTEWDWLTMEKSDFALKYPTEQLLEQLEVLKEMLSSDFYDQMLLKEMVRENLERGLENGYSLDVYFNNLL